MRWRRRSRGCSGPCSCFSSSVSWRARRWVVRGGRGSTSDSAARGLRCQPWGSDSPSQSSSARCPSGSLDLHGWCFCSWRSPCRPRSATRRSRARRAHPTATLAVGRAPVPHRPRLDRPGVALHSRMPTNRGRACEITASRARAAPIGGGRRPSRRREARRPAHAADSRRRRRIGIPRGRGRFGLRAW